jgi:hypothetical protein
MGAELSFQIADIDSSHSAIIADVTMLVICYSSSGMRGLSWSHLMTALRLQVNFPRVLGFVARDLSREPAA